MNINRKIAITVGILFILGTVSGIVSFFFTGEMTNSHEYLVKIAAGDKQFILGSLFVLLMGFSVAFIPILLYPYLKNYNKTLAIGYVVFRGAIETVAYIAIWVSMILMLFVSKNFIVKNNADYEQIKNLVALILRLRELSSLISVIIFGIGALLLYSVLYQSKLVSRWLSVWGFIAVILYLVAGFLNMFGLQTESSDVNSYLSLPIFLQEMVMAIWLIVKGFKLKNDPNTYKQ